jgi:Protein of unknown function (DUF2934)/Cytochrome c
MRHIPPYWESVGANNIATPTRAWMERMSESKPRRKRQAKSTQPKSTSPRKMTELSEQEMRDAAYYLWEQEGRPEGRALDHWLQVTGQRNESMNVR